MNEPGVNYFEQALLKDTVTRKMEEVALKTKPELLVTGTGHGMMIRGDFGIPKNKFALFHGGQELYDYLKKEVMAVRRFQRTRRKMRKQRAKTPTKPHYKF